MGLERETERALERMPGPVLLAPVFEAGFRARKDLYANSLFRK